MPTPNFKSISINPSHWDEKNTARIHFISKIYNFIIISIIAIDVVRNFVEPKRNIFFLKMKRKTLILQSKRKSIAKFMRSSLCEISLTFYSDNAHDTSSSF
jgi:hypothetical protein